MENTNKPKIRQVAGAVPEKKKNLWEKTADVLFAEDLETVKESVTTTIIKPYFRDFVVDLIVGFVEKWVYGVGPGKKGPTPGGGRIRSAVNNVVNASYQPYYLNAQQTRTTQRSDLYTVKEIVMQDMAAAEDLLRTLSDYITQYKQVTVNDLYDCIGYTGIENDCWYGWKNLDGVQYKHVPGGVRVVFPKPIELN